jgi:tRNA dimethylallyltransferase
VSTRVPSKILVIVGATGTGKSELSLTIADRLRDGGVTAEIINADAMQLYRGMDIGTAKVSPAERRDITHHMIDVLEVTDEGAVADYQRDARTAISKTIDAGNVPILVGGSGLYVSSVLFDFEFPGHDDHVRARLEQELETFGAAEMFARLQKLAPDVANRIDHNNERRVIRALEVIEVTGGASSLGTLPEQSEQWMPATIVGLEQDRATLVERLDARVIGMWKSGLVDEVRSLVPRGIESGVTARRAIGYAQALSQVHGHVSESEAIEQTQALTRRYARRQVSWFRRYSGVNWLSASNSHDAVSAHADSVVRAFVDGADVD